MEKILIFRHLSPQEKEEINVRHANGASVFVLPGLLTNIESEHELIKDSLIKEAISELIEIIKNTGDKEIGDYIQGTDLESGNKSLSGFLTVDKVPLWHYQRFRVYFLLRHEWIVNHCIKNYCDNDFNITCYVPNFFSLWPECTGEHIKIIRETDYKRVNQHSLKRDNRSKSRNKSTNRINFVALFNYIVFFNLRILISIFRVVNLHDKKYVIIDRSIRQQCRNLITLEKKWDNFNLYTLFDLNVPGQLIISEVETPKLRSSQPFRLHRYFFNGEGRKEKTIYGEWILFRGLTSFKVFKEYKNLKKSFEDKCKSLISAFDTINESQMAVSAKDQLVIRTFVSLKKSSAFYLLKYLCYKQFFNRFNFTNVTAIDENSPATRSILDAGKACGMKAIGIQHGNIGDSQPAYLYTEKDRQTKVMTDITVTWGNYWAEFLINKANFPPESIKIAGQMRSDLIPVMLRNADVYRNNISDTPYLVVFASQPIPDSNYRHKVAYDVFSCFSSLPDAKLIVKLHPAERNSVSYYKAIAEEAGYRDPDIRYDIDLYELLAASDLVITCYSTVGSEAIYFGKPLIIYDPFKEDILKYVSEGVAFQATDLGSLTMLVEQLINGSLAPDKEDYSNFINKYAFAIDGDATKRTLMHLQ